jgi:hypothetical protein
MINVNGEEDESFALIEDKRRRLIGTQHRNMIINIDYVSKERKFITVR